MNAEPNAKQLIDAAMPDEAALDTELGALQREATVRAVIEIFEQIRDDSQGEPNDDD